jgi:hypothetical protein
VTFNGAKDFRRDVFGLSPMLFIPLVEHCYRATGYLDVKFDVLGNSG